VTIKRSFLTPGVFKTQRFDPNQQLNGPNQHQLDGDWQQG